MPRCTNLTYNGITLALVHTNSVQFKPKYTSDMVQYLWTDVTIDVNCIFNPMETAYAPGDGTPPVETPGTNPTDTINAIRYYLLQPRGQLTFGFSGDLMITSPAFGIPCDADNGPIPLTCEIRSIEGNTTFKIHFVIKTSILECPSGQCSPALIANRFSQSQTINREYYTEIITRGEAHFRTDILEDAETTADHFRNGLLPTLALYFQRESVNFGVNAAGNVITYECKDVEKPYDLGNTSVNGTGAFAGTYITHLEGSHTVQTVTREQGVASGQTVATTNVKIWGSRPASNWNLTQIAFQIINNKIKFAQNLISQIRNISITQDLFNRYVDVTVAMMVNAFTGGPLPGGIRTTSLVVDAVVPDQGGVNPQPWQDNGTRGSSGYYLLSQQLIDAACACNGTPDADNQGVAGFEETAQTGSTPIVTVSPTTLNPVTLDRYNTTTTEFPYADARIASHYQTAMGTIQAPIGVPTGIPQPYSNPGQPRVATSVVVNVSNPITRRVVNWTVERWNQVPQIPAAISNDPNQTLLTWTMDMNAVPVLEDGITPVFRISGQYVYALLVDVTQIPVIAFDEIQWVDYPFGTYAIDTTPGNGDAVSGLIDPLTGGP